jgi:hypothetical protein
MGPRSVHCICCFLTNRLLTTWLIVDSTNAVLIGHLSHCLAQDGVAQSLVVRNILLFLCPSATLAAMMCYNMRKGIINLPAL